LLNWHGQIEAYFNKLNRIGFEWSPGIGIAATGWQNVGFEKSLAGRIFKLGKL